MSNLKTRAGITAAIGVLLLILTANSAYLAAFASPTLFYMANLAAHIVLGVLLLVAGLVLAAVSRDVRRLFPMGFALLLISAALGLFLAQKGALIEYRWVLWTHIGAAVAGLALLVLAARRKAAEAGGGWRSFHRAAAVTLALLVAAPIASAIYERLFPASQHRIVNSVLVPTSMEEEGAGPESPYWPSGAKTIAKGHIPSHFFMSSEKCGECHKDIYDQWRSSVHRFASFNNQFYRKSIEHMQGIAGTKPSRWCAGCHDHAVLFSGKWDTPIVEQMDTPEAHAGLGCISCHAIVHVDGSVGNGSFTIEYPDIHDLVVSDSPFVRWLADFLTFADPEPHRRTFLKPFMKSENSAEFCASCHKVHLDVPVNDYRWIRGFNNYDNWQASGVSGHGARSFYYPPVSKTCSDCHMPLVDSRDPGHRNGKVHSHRFAAANTAVAFVNKDEEQLREVLEFLQSGFITLDIFAVTPADEKPGELPMLRRAGEEQQLMSTFAVGEEAQATGPYVIREVGEIAAPLDRVKTGFAPGSTVRVDVVARTRTVGHFFPDGTVDSFDVWIELEARDATGRQIFLSGGVEDGGKGPVDPGAHFYRAYLLDGESNPINKRNAWQARSTLYVRLIPPGAADVAHYRVAIPRDAQGPVTLTAKLNYRKFSHFYTQFSYAGEPEDGPGKVARNHDSREYSFDPANIPKNVSGNVKNEIPDLPIVTVAKAETRLPLLGPGASPEWTPVVQRADFERWNDWGIGLLQQGDLKGAEYAFTKVTEAYPQWADGWLNVARALIQEGETERAKPFIEKALTIDASLARIHFFKALIEKADGDYDAAIASLERVLASYPRDRVALNQLGRLYFLKREYAPAVAALERVLEIDPEDVQAHYNLMLSYRGLGDVAKAERAEKLFRRFKADEASQTITARRRMLSPEDNNERQPIHDHVSMPLPATPSPSFTLPPREHSSRPDSPVPQTARLAP